ncbi:MAG TPA: hypothetical protein PK335_12155 [Draconibacterium sp.]|nr:hypothetical protein [Draconibacterium sp.]
MKYKERFLTAFYTCDRFLSANNTILSTNYNKNQAFTLHIPFSAFYIEHYYVD